MHPQLSVNGQHQLQREEKQQVKRQDLWRSRILRSTW